MVGYSFGRGFVQLVPAPFSSVATGIDLGAVPGSGCHVVLLE